MSRPALTALACVLLLGGAGPVAAATFVVNKLTDTNDGVCDADCSLREAVAAAVLAPGDDVIVFDGGVFGTPQTLTLGGSEIAISGGGSLLIEGPGAALLTLDGNNASRIFSNNVGAVTTLRGLRLTRGNGAGAINSGRGGAIYNVGGTLVLERVTLSGNAAANGGAVNNAAFNSVPGVLSIIDCRLENNNTTSSGGALQNFSTSSVFISGSTVSGNSSGGTIGGGGAQLNGFATLVNSTFSGNTAAGGAGGAISSNGARLLIVNSTLTGNGATVNAGGIHRNSSLPGLLLRNSLFADNTGGASPDVSSTSPVSSLGNNLVGIAGDTAGWIASDLLNQAANLAPLADNGGPAPTHALLGGSAAIDAAQSCVLDRSCASENLDFDLVSDQRGQPRFRGDGVDIGAFELNTRLFGDGFEAH